MIPSFVTGNLKSGLITVVDYSLIDHSAPLAAASAAQWSQHRQVCLGNGASFAVNGIIRRVELRLDEVSADMCIECCLVCTHTADG